VTESSVSAPPRYKAAFDIQLSTNNNAQFVQLDAGGVKGRFSDNGFLFHTADKTIQFFALEDITAADLQSKITVSFLTQMWGNIEF
jgi:hypothetical protein